MISLIKTFVLFVMIIQIKCGRIQNKYNHKDLMTSSSERVDSVENVHDESLNGNNSKEDDFDEMDIANAAKLGSFTDRLKNVPAKVLMSIVANGQQLKSGIEKMLMQGKLSEGGKQYLEGVLGLLKDSFNNLKDLTFG